MTILANLGISHPGLPPLPPEHFWFMGLKPKDRREMIRQLKLAHEKQSRIEEKFSMLSTADKLTFERAYCEMLERMEPLAEPKP